MCKATGLNDVCIQDLCYSFGNALMSSETSLHEVQKILGHNDQKNTMRYAHFVKGSLLDCADKVGEVIQ